MGANERIFNALIPEFIAHQTEKAKDYNSVKGEGLPDGFENADVLGVAGQFAEIWRKIWKLKRAMWDGSKLVGEQPREILLDLIGHAFLAIDMIDRKSPRPAAEPKEGPLPFISAITDRDRLRNLTGHGYDGCAVCTTQVRRIAESKESKTFDWGEDIP